MDVCVVESYDPVIQMLHRHILDPVAREKTGIQRYPTLVRGVSERAMQHLPVQDKRITGITEQRNRTVDPIRARFLHHLPDIYPSQFMTARQNPNAIRRRARVELGHEVEAMRAMVPIVRIPMSCPILMPSDRGSETGFLNKSHFVIRHEIGTEHCFRHPE